MRSQPFLFPPGETYSSYTILHHGLLIYCFNHLQDITHDLTLKGDNMEPQVLYYPTEAHRHNPPFETGNCYQEMLDTSKPFSLEDGLWVLNDTNNIFSLPVHPFSISKACHSWFDYMKYISPISSWNDWHSLSVGTLLLARCELGESYDAPPRFYWCYKNKPPAVQYNLRSVLQQRKWA